MRFCQSRPRQGPPALLFVRFHSIVSCSWPSQLFLGWHCDPCSQSDIESGSKLERDTHRASSAFARPAGRVLGHGCQFSSPQLNFSSHKDQEVRVQCVDRHGIRFAGPCSNLPGPMQTPSCCVPRCSGLAPQIPPGLAPPVTDRQGRCGGLWNLDLTTNAQP